MGIALGRFYFQNPWVSLAVTHRNMEIKEKPIAEIHDYLCSQTLLKKPFSSLCLQIPGSGTFSYKVTISDSLLRKQGEHSSSNYFAGLHLIWCLLFILPLQCRHQWRFLPWNKHFKGQIKSDNSNMPTKTERDCTQTQHKQTRSSGLIQTSLCCNEQPAHEEWQLNCPVDIALFNLLAGNRLIYLRILPEMTTWSSGWQ